MQYINLFVTKNVETHVERDKGAGGEVVKVGGHSASSQKEVATLLAAATLPVYLLPRPIYKEERTRAYLPSYLTLSKTQDLFTTATSLLVYHSSDPSIRKTSKVLVQLLISQILTFQFDHGCRQESSRQLR